MDVTVRRQPLPSLIRPEHDATTLKPTPWAGTRLAGLKGRSPTDGPYGESLEFSTLPGTESRAAGGKLTELIGQPLPFAAKLLDTRAPLSIQVHPTDDVANGSPGKEEAWVILDADRDAYVLAGAKKGVTDEALRDAMTQAIESPERGEVLTAALNRIPVSRGMVIMVPAGTVHSVGPGILLAEMHQPIDVTFRLFDRGSTRPIHPEAAHAAWRIDASPVVWRPGDAAAPIDGLHLRLQVHESEDVTIDEARTPRLLIAIGDGVVVSANGEDPIEMLHGDLLLHLHGDFSVRMNPESTLVTGTIRGANT